MSTGLQPRIITMK